MANDPIARRLRSLAQGTGFLEKVSRSLDNQHLAEAGHLVMRFLVQLENLSIITSDNQKCGRSDVS